MLQHPSLVLTVLPPLPPPPLCTASPAPSPQAIAAEKERIAKEKELETARLRGLQQKVLDTRSTEDELRARRYQVGGVCGCVGGGGGGGACKAYHP